MTPLPQILVAFLLFVLSFSVRSELFAQDNNSDTGELNKNALHLSGGSFGLWFTGNAYYDRMIKQKMWNKNASSYSSTGGGYFITWEEEGAYIFTRLGILVGREKNYFELNAGPSLSITRQSSFFISGNAGWRHQKPGGNFVFRLGVGLPEGFYVGAGFSF